MRKFIILCATLAAALPARAAEVTRFSLENGMDVVVIGGGMTAVDAAVQSKLLGAQNVTIANHCGGMAGSSQMYSIDLILCAGNSLR